MNNFIECATHKYSSFIIEQCVLKQGLFSEQLLDVDNIKQLAINLIEYHFLIAVLQSNSQRISEIRIKLRRIFAQLPTAIDLIGISILPTA